MVDVKDIKTIKQMAQDDAKKHFAKLEKMFSIKYEKKIYLKTFIDTMLILERNLKLPEGMKNG